MKMRLMFLVLTIWVIGAVTLSVGAMAEISTGGAQLHPYNQSGIKAKINFLDTGSSLVVSGTATGLDPNNSYISLLYDQRSVPGGPLACEPSDSNTLTFAQMSAGAWQVSADGTGTLNFTKTGAPYVPLAEIASMSIRGGAEDFERVACGRIHENP